MHGMTRGRVSTNYRPYGITAKYAVERNNLRYRVRPFGHADDARFIPRAHFTVDNPTLVDVLRAVGFEE